MIIRTMSDVKDNIFMSPNNSIKAVNVRQYLDVITRLFSYGPIYQAARGGAEG